MYHAVETHISVFKIQSGNAIKKKKTFREGARETQRKGERARDDDDSRLALSFPPH